MIHFEKRISPQTPHTRLNLTLAMGSACFLKCIISVQIFSGGPDLFVGAICMSLVVILILSVSLFFGLPHIWLTFFVISFLTCFVCFVANCMRLSPGYTQLVRLYLSILSISIEPKTFLYYLTVFHPSLK